MDNNINNSGVIDSTGESRGSLYLSSVKTWNDHIRRNPFVKDHTAVPLPSLPRDHSTWTAIPTEMSFSTPNGTTNSAELQMFTGDDSDLSTAKTNEQQTTSLKKAFEMASRTREMLNKLDGWKALSLKAYPTSSPQNTAPISGGYMIKSSSQFTTLDAKSNEAKNILQNIKDMAQIFCPPEYGGVSHFRIMHDEQSQATCQYSSAPRSSVVVPEIHDTNKLTINNNFIPNQVMVSDCTKTSTFQPCNPSLSIPSCRINIVGMSNKPIIQYAPSQIHNFSNMESSLSGNIPVISSGGENGKSLSQNLTSFVGNEANQRSSLIKVKALYEDLMSKLNTRQDDTNIHNKNSDSLYEDFDDGLFSSMSTLQPPFSSSIPSLGPESHDLLKSNLNRTKNIPNKFVNPSKEKDHEEWEKETQDFLRKLRVKSGGARKDTRQVIINPRPLMEISRKGSKDEVDRNYNAHYNGAIRSASNCSSSSSATRCEDKHRPERSSRVEIRPIHKSVNSNNSRFSSRTNSKQRDLSTNSKDSSQKLTFYDDHSHGCENCGLTDMKLDSYLDHLLTEEHVKKMKDLPWKSFEFDESLLVKSKSERCRPIKGSESIYPVTSGFYCKPCEKYYHNKEDMLHHLTTNFHDDGCYFYEKNSRKRQSDTNPNTLAKKPKIDQEIPQSTASIITGKIENSRSNKEENNKKNINTKRGIDVKEAPRTSVAKRNNTLKSDAQKKAANNKLKVELKTASDALKTNTNDYQNRGSQVNSDVNHVDDIESECDFLELDEWTEDN